MYNTQLVKVDYYFNSILKMCRAWWYLSKFVHCEEKIYSHKLNKRAKCLKVQDINKISLEPLHGHFYRGALSQEFQQSLNLT